MVNKNYEVTGIGIFFITFSMASLIVGIIIPFVAILNKENKFLYISVIVIIYIIISLISLYKIATFHSHNDDSH